MGQKSCNVDFNALCVVTRQCAAKPHRVYRRLKDMGFRYIQFIACLDPIGEERGKEPYSLLPSEYGQFLCAFFDDWYNDWKTGYYTSVRQFDDYIHLMTETAPSSCSASGRCGSYLVSEADGSLYPCDFYVLDQWKLGNVNSISVLDAMTSAKAREFIADRGRKPEQCNDCRWESICHGGCKRDITLIEGKADNYYCESFRFFLEYTETRLIEIAKAELDAIRAKKRHPANELPG